MAITTSIIPGTWKALGDRANLNQSRQVVGAGKGSVLMVTDRNHRSFPFLLLHLSCPLKCSVLPGMPVGLCCSFADVSRMQIGKGA